MTDYLEAFVTESNLIEGIIRPPTEFEVEATRTFVHMRHITPGDVANLVNIIANAPMRTQVGMDVSVGTHIPPLGGPDIRKQLRQLLIRADMGDNAHGIHLQYETLHPFMDGNGRSGRAIWAWQRMRAGQSLEGGFLKMFYYETLENCEERNSIAIDSGRE